MRLGRDVLKSPPGQLALVGAVLVSAVIAVRWQRRAPAPLPAARPSIPAALPRTFTREGVKFPKLTPSPVMPTPTMGAASSQPTDVPVTPDKPRVLPLTLFAVKKEPPLAAALPFAPYGRLIPCETVVTLESNRLETPVIGLVTEDVWHDGRLVVPAGAEVHGRAALDRTRERLAAQGSWRIVWRTPDGDNGTELAVDGLALDREFDAATGTWGEHDGSAGLRGEVVKTGDDRELKLFAATFLSTATAALQDTRSVTGLLGEASVPAMTARNASLSGTGAVLREYAQQLRDAITRDGFYLRVPAGKPFYLYVTEPIDRSRARRAGTAIQTNVLHEN